MSHPSWVCGLKLRMYIDPEKGSVVTPFVGVWIETYVISYRNITYFVTPFVGVWIETCRANYVNASFAGHTLRGCVD